jgi:hypothetical protein
MLIILVLVALSLWVVASIAGTVGQSLPREALFTTSDGRSLGFCQTYQPDAVLSGKARATDYCTTDQIFGASQPADARSYPGRILTENLGLSDWVDVFTRPDLWLTIGLGGAAILLMYVFWKATRTLRAGLAAAVSIVFLGLLLFPAAFTARIPGDMRAELVTAWQWVIIFYFGSEAAVQAWKISHRDDETGGDAADAGSAETPATTAAFPTVGPTQAP